MKDRNLVEKYLIEILNIPSPTGYTYEMIEYLMKQFNNMDINYKISNKGSLLATIQGMDQDYDITFSVHVDTLGAIVKEVKENGRIVINQIGGYMIHSVEGECVLIHCRNGKQIEGTLQTIKPSIHIFENEASELPRNCKNYEVVLDEEVFSKEDVLNLGIDIGDIISFDTRTKITKSGFIKSRYLDDKASIASILYVISYINNKKIIPRCNINFMFTNYEEVGHGGSAFIPNNTKEFIAVDMGCVGKGQNSTEYDVCISCKDSNGPYDYSLLNELISVCKSNNINYKLDIYPNYGSDATAALKSGLDARFGLIGPGIFASHGYERTHIKSIYETIKLIIKYITK